MQLSSQNASSTTLTACQPEVVPNANPQEAVRELVVLIHGLCAHPLVMLPLARKLQHAGYATVNWGYRSTWRDIATHAERLRRTFVQIDGDSSVSTVHVVAHSMGCIVTRQALLHDLPKKIGRVVMLCPPNRGSHVATKVSPLFGRICRTLVEIADVPNSWVNRLPMTLPTQVPVGIIIAGGDLVVAMESTILPGVEHSHTIAGMHSGILFKRATAEATIRFLRHGRF